MFVDRWPAVCLILAASIAAPGSAAAQTDPERRAPAALSAEAAERGAVRVIVRLRAAYRLEGRLDRAAAAAQRARIRDRIREVMDRTPGLSRARRFRLIPGFAAEVDAATLAQLASDPDVEGIEVDRRMRPALAQSAGIVGAPQTWSSGYTGRGWTIAVLDTGVDASHPFLAGKVVSEACYSNNGGTAGGTSLCPGGAASSTAPGAGRPCSFAGCDHGTHVAGIAAGASASLSGIAPDASLISIQVFTRFDTTADCGFQVPCLLSYASDEILALERVFTLRQTHNIAAVNMSLGGGRYFSQSRCDAENASLKASIDQLRSVGIATVASSGNDGYFDSMSAPACISSAVSVGATSKTDVISGFTNAASFLSLLAPGSLIASSVPGGPFAFKSGTSMSTPHVAAAWALLKERRPSAGVAQILSLLRSTGVPLVDSLSNRTYPRLRIDAAAAALLSMEMALDAPFNDQMVAGPFTVGGWAFDPLAESGAGVDAVHVWAYPSTGAPIFVGAAALGGSRPDVGAAFGARFASSGFNLTVQGLAGGSYRLVAYAHSSATGAFDEAREVRITVAGAVSAPFGAIDSPAAGAAVGSAFTVSGWAIDRGAPIGAGVDAVHVYAYPNPGSGAPPIFLGVANAGQPRADIASTFGPAFINAGYHLAVSGLAPGAYRLVIFSHSTVSGAFNALTREVIVRTPGDTQMAIDTPTSGATVSSGFAIAGWAIDRDATFGTGIDTVHVWAYPVGGGAPRFLGVAAYGGLRSDVSALFGPSFAASGYQLITTGLPPGSFDVVVYPHSVVTGTFATGKIVRIVVN